MSSNILWIVFAVVVVLFAVMSLVYVYHWRTYGTGNRTISIVEKIYIIVGLMLVLASALFILTR